MDDIQHMCHEMISIWRSSRGTKNQNKIWNKLSWDENEPIKVIGSASVESSKR